MGLGGFFKKVGSGAWKVIKAPVVGVRKVGKAIDVAADVRDLAQEVGKVNGTKGLLQSKTIWGLLGTLLAPLLIRFGIDITAIDLGATVQTILELGGALASFLFGVWGRIQAKKKVVVGGG